MKKTLKFLAIFSMLFTMALSVTGISAKANDEPELYMTIITNNVNKTFSKSLYNNGCYGNATFRVKGSYDVQINGTTQSATNFRLSASTENVTANWRCEVISISSRNVNGRAQVTISYRFLTTYFDCPMTGGWFYDSTVVTV